MSIAKEGFLSSELVSFIAEIRNKNKKYFNLAVKVNKFALKSMKEICVINDEAKKIVVTCAALIASVELYQSAILLLERGIILSTSPTLRTLLEYLFVICAIAEDKKDGNFLDHFIISTDDRNKLELVNALTSDGLSDSIKEYLGKKNDEEVEKLQEKVNENNKSGYYNLRMKRLVERGKCEDFHSIWVSLTMDSHPTIPSLNQRVYTDKKTSKKSLAVPHPSSNISSQLTITIEVMVEILKHVGKITKSNWKNRLDSFKSELKKINQSKLLKGKRIFKSLSKDKKEKLLEIEKRGFPKYIPSSDGMLLDRIYKNLVNYQEESGD
jgi:hypothetical protein